MGRIQSPAREARPSGAAMAPRPDGAQSALSLLAHIPPPATGVDPASALDGDAAGDSAARQQDRPDRVTAGNPCTRCWLQASD